MYKMNVIAEPGKQEIIITRMFDAPPALVFRAHTDPEAIAQWWGPRKYSTRVDKLEARKGGIWRYLNIASDGAEFAFNGVFHEVVESERMVNTFEFEGLPGHIGLVTLTFEDQSGRTLLTESSLFQSIEDRDGMLQSGMEEGAAESMDRLEEYLRARS